MLEMCVSNTGNTMQSLLIQFIKENNIDSLLLILTIISLIFCKKMDYTLPLCKAMKCEMSSCSISKLSCTFLDYKFIVSYSEIPKILAKWKGDASITYKYVGVIGYIKNILFHENCVTDDVAYDKGNLSNKHCCNLVTQLNLTQEIYEFLWYNYSKQTFE